MSSQVQNLLQQMQGRFATMSDAIIGRSAKRLLTRLLGGTLTLSHRLLCHSCRVVDEMGHRIDELENSIGELMAQAGIDEEPSADGAAPPARSAATPGLRDPLV